MALFTVILAVVVTNAAGIGYNLRLSRWINSVDRLKHDWRLPLEWHRRQNRLLIGFSAMCGLAAGELLWLYALAS